MVNTVKIKSLLKIEDLIKRYMKLEYKNTNNLHGCCCFHGETSPSLLVNTVEGYFKCFGCGIGGDVIKFHSEINHLSYNESATLLAIELGLQQDGGELNLLKKINQFYQDRIEEGKEFLMERGFSREDAAQFGLGFSGDAFELYDEFKTYKDSLLSLGFIQIKNANTPAEVIVSTMFDRIMIPIESSLGVISFVGRKIEGEGPKYIGLNDHMYCNKNQTWYGLDQKTIENIVSEGFVYIVEGPFDVIRMKLNGYPNTIGSLGTGLSKYQLSILRRLTNRIVFIYDNDDGGMKALHRNSLLAIKSGMAWKMIELPFKQDPDSYLLEYGTLDALSLYDSDELFTLLYTHDEVVELLHSCHDTSIIDPKLLSAFRISLDFVKKEKINLGFKSSKIYEVTPWVQLAAFLDVYPQYKEQLNENEEDLVEEALINPCYVDMKMCINYKGIKDPEDFFNRLRGLK